MKTDNLKNLIKLSDQIFEKAVKVEVEPTDIWEDNFFKKDWFKQSGNQEKYITQSPGWYWIGCDIDFEELQEMKLIKENKLPRSACQIKNLSLNNYKIFGEDYLCKVDVNGSRIIYNGHQGNVLTRIRQHFTLNNENTGALGLKYYPLSQKRWVIRYFGKSHIERLTSDIQSDVKNIISKQSGRIAIENAWRAKHGWPILCKA